MAMSGRDPSAGTQFDYKNKVVVLTGGASGMGRSFITHILARGGIVSFGDINTSLSKSLLLQIHSSAPRLVSRLLFTKTDIRDPIQVKHLLTRTQEVFGGVNYLLCVAGVNVPDSFLPSEHPRPDAANLLSIEINLTGTINTVYTALPFLKQEARIVLIASTAGIYPSSVQPLYSASKHGLIGFARGLAPLLPKGQRIFVLAPSTYLPPHHGPGQALKMSDQMGTGNDGDVFTSVIRNTLGFVEMSTILHTLDTSLNSAINGSVLEITPMGVASPTFPEAPPRILHMESTLRRQLCGDRHVESVPATVHVKHEPMNE